MKCHWKIVQDDVDKQPVCAHQQGDGDVTIETYTVVHNRDDSPNRLVVVARNSNGDRVWATSTESSLMNDAETTELIGQRGSVRDGLFLL